MRLGTRWARWSVVMAMACSTDRSATVDPDGRVVRLELLPAQLTLPVGGVRSLEAVAYDGSGRRVSDVAVTFGSDAAGIATTSATGVVTGIAAGSARITASAAGRSASATVTVIAAANAVVVDPVVAFQTMTGWQALSEDGWLECDATAYARYRDEVHRRAVEELGINRITVMLRSSAEDVRDRFQDFVSGAMSAAEFRNSWFYATNDNADPFAADPGRFAWGYVDAQMDRVVVPIRQRVAARGERLFVVLQYVDFNARRPSNPAYRPMAIPDEYAELVVEAFRHLREKYGVTPDAFELILEPEHSVYTPTEIGRAMVAANARLRSAGFTPQIIGPSTTSMTNASLFYDAMMAVPGARGVMSELAYHRYVGVSDDALRAIGDRVRRDGVRSSMLEHIGSGFDELYDDLTVGLASAWQQFALAYCGEQDAPSSGEVYFQINQSAPSSPRIHLTEHARLLRQIFAHVRMGAVRIGAMAPPGASALKPLAFRNVNGRLVVVVRTRAATALSLFGLPAGVYGMSYGTTEQSAASAGADVTVGASGSASVTMPSSGVLTLFAR